MRPGIGSNASPRWREIPNAKLWAKLVLWWTWGQILLGLAVLLIPSLQSFQVRWFEIGLPLAALLTIGANRRHVGTALISASLVAAVVFLVVSIHAANLEPERLRWYSGGAVAVTILLVGLAAEASAMTAKIPGLMCWRTPAAGLVAAVVVGLMGGLATTFGSNPEDLALGKAILRALNTGVYQEFVFRAFLLTVLAQVSMGQVRRAGGSGRLLGPILLAGLAQGAAHPEYGVWVVLSSITFGMGFGWLYIRYGLAFAALAHVITDFFQILR